jgi:membrane-associated phospholipid phosphatase
MVIALAFLILLHTSITLLTTATAIIVLLAICIAVTLKWKVSLHTAWAASVIMILTFVFGPFYLLLAPLVVLVAWARWQVHAHTLWQLLAGTVLAILIVSITFGVFRL